MKKTVDVKILDARLHEHPPAYATPGSAGIDLRACIDHNIIIQPGQTELIPSGIAIHLNDTHYAAMIGVAYRHGRDVDAIRAVLPDAAPADLDRALQLARSGPPEEEVGLEPFAPPEYMGGRR